MSNLGMGVMVKILGGYEEDVKNFKAAVGKEIKEVELVNDRLQFKFTDDTGIYFWDSGQSCCESRYMVCDDNLLEFVGATLLDAETANGPETQSEYGEEHQIQFLRVTTSAGVIVCSNHNEHNGFYGGFSISVGSL